MGISGNSTWGNVGFLPLPGQEWPYAAIYAEGQLGLKRHSQDKWFKLIKGIFCTIWQSTQCIKLGERWKKEGTFGIMVFVIQSHHCTWRGPAFLNTCLSMGSSELTPCFALLAGIFCFHYWIAFISIHEFLAFTVMILSPVSRGYWLLAGVKPWQLCRRQGEKE